MALKRSRPARWLLTALLGVAALGFLARYLVLPVLFWRRAEACERPEYTVLGSLPAETLHHSPVTVELRRYEPYLVAEVQVPAGLSEDEMQKLGFGQVAGYIFGDNLRRRSGFLGRYMAMTAEEPEPIAMTAPVQQELAHAQMSAHEESTKLTAVSFTMPSKYKHLSQLPVPKNSNVTLRAVPEHYAAVVGFRGPPPKPAKVSDLRWAMRAALEAAGLERDHSRGVMVYQYHDPFATPNMLRWNEVVMLLHPHGLENLIGQKDES